MIASWMSYAIALSAVMTVAALALEPVAAARGMPRRFVWGGALLVSVVWPLVNVLVRLAPHGPVEVLPFAITVPGPIVIAHGDGLDRAALVDRALVALWIAVSLTLLARLAHAMVSLRRARRSWARELLDGTSVRVTRNVGPAVIGIRRMEVVVPEWIRALDATLRAIVLCHEEEHRAARDPHLLLGAAIAVALLPWNLPLWIQARRLRLAVELDCDARVLRVHPSPERYGRLMLTIAQRRSAALTLFAPMLTEPTTQLERRILAMRATTRRLARLTIIGGSVVAVAAIVFACSLRSDNPTSPTPSASRTSATASASEGQVVYREFQVTRPVMPASGDSAPRYPDTLREANQEGEVLAEFVVGTDGRVDMSTFRILRSSHELFSAAVRGALPGMRFVPANVNGREVKQLVQMPFEFNLSKSSWERAAAAGKGPVIAGRVVSAARAGNDTQTVRRLPPVRAIATRPDTTAAPVRVSDSTSFADFQVEQMATALPGNTAPRYPDVLRKSNVEGDVVAQFVVDTSGTADLMTFKVLRSTDAAFTQAVREALATYRFAPARVGGRAVKQLMQMPFVFRVSKQ